MEAGIIACSITHLYPPVMGWGSTTSHPPQNPQNFTVTGLAPSSVPCLPILDFTASVSITNTIPLVPGSPSLKNFLPEITFKKLETVLQNFLVLLSEPVLGAMTPCFTPGGAFIYHREGPWAGAGCPALGSESLTSQPRFDPLTPPSLHYPTRLGISALPSLQGISSRENER